MDKKLIGTTKVALGWKISLLRDVADKLNVEIGDKLVYYEKDNQIIIEKV